MIKIILSLLLSLLPLVSNAQIRNDVDGVILGKSKFLNVILHVRNSNMQYKIDDKGNIECTGKFYFGGITWNTKSYSFHKGVLKSVVYAETVNNLDYSTIKEDYDYLGKMLSTKYGKYQKSKSAVEVIFSDGKVMIGLDKFENLLTLLYADVHLMEQQQDDAFNDL